MPTLKIYYQLVNSLTPYANNPRTHSKTQIQQIARSITAFGFTNPVLVDDQNGIIAGHGRLEAAKLLGLEEVPTVQLSSMDEAQKRAYIIADNRLAETAGWDNEILAIELQCLIDLDFEVELTGFDTPQIDLILEASNTPCDESDVIADELYEGPPISKLGDLWYLGPHRLLCADATQSASYDQLLGGQKAQMIFTDPPYNVPIQGHVTGNGKVKHREFAMASGEMSESEFIDFLGTVTQLLCNYSDNGSIHYLCMDWRHVYELTHAVRHIYTELKNICVWNKDNGGMGSLYRSKHELVLVFKNGSEPHTNNIELGKHGRHRTNVWDYPSANSWKTDDSEGLAIHPTVKPVNLVADAIRDCSHIGNIILDPFSGSGTTILGAEKTNRQAMAIELDPLYVDVAIRRYHQLTGQWATLSSTGNSFPVVEQQLKAQGAT